jgi:hypothetical protein
MELAVSGILSITSIGAKENTVQMRNANNRKTATAAA